MNGQTVIASNSERVLEIINYLQPLQEKIEKIITAKDCYQALLLEPRLLFRHRKSFVSFLAALRLYNSCKNSGGLAKEVIDNSISEIAKYDREFAVQVKSILPAPSGTGSIFTDLIRAIEQGRQYITSYILTNLEELNAKARSIKDVKSSKELVALFSIISGREAEILGRYKNDSDDWVKAGYALKYDINFFLRRIDLYLRGGFEGNERFFGIVNDFGDKEFAEKILKNPKIRSLWKFYKQLKYLNSLIILCRKSETPEGLKEWKGFWGEKILRDFDENDEDVGFWGKKEDEKGRNFDRHAELFETLYGNDDFKKRLMAEKSKRGELPEAWGGQWQGNALVKPGFLHQLLAILQHPTYQRQNIIMPASLELHKLLEARESELRAKQEESIGRLIKLLEELSGMGISRDKVLGRFKGLLKKKRRLLLRKLNNDTSELTSKLVAFVPDYQNYMKNLDAVISRIDTRFMSDYMEKLYQTAMKNLRFVWQQISRNDYLNDIRAGVLMSGADRAAQAAWLQRKRIIKFEHLGEEDLIRMDNLVIGAREILYRLEEIYTYISGKIKEEYLLDINSLQDINIEKVLEIIRNKEWEFGYVKKTMSRLI